MAALPIAKLFYLAVRTAARPVAGAIRRHAKGHPRFRAACVGLARMFHRAETRLAPRQAGRPLDEARAVELGAEFIGEALVFGIAGSLLVADVLASRRAEAARRADIDARISALERHIAKAGV